MAAALFAGAASGGGGTGVSVTYYLRSRAAAAPAQISSSDPYKALGTGLLGVAAVAERCVTPLRKFAGFCFFGFVWHSETSLLIKVSQSCYLSHTRHSHAPRITDNRLRRPTRRRARSTSKN